MLQQILLFTIPAISTKAMVITTIPSNMPGQEFSTKLCVTRTANPENRGFGAIKIAPISL